MCAHMLKVIIASVRTELHRIGLITNHVHVDDNDDDASVHVGVAYTLGTA